MKLDKSYYHSENLIAGNDLSEECFFVKSDRELKKIWKQEIVYLEGMGNYLAIHTANKKIVIYGSLKVFEEKLASLKLVTIHKSYRVPLKKIERVTKKKVFLETATLPLSRYYKGSLEKFFQVK